VEGFGCVIYETWFEGRTAGSKGKDEGAMSDESGERRCCISSGTISSSKELCTV
jgi:hypothetical protein